MIPLHSAIAAHGFRRAFWHPHVAPAGTVGAPAAFPRRVSMWYAPGAYGGTDINASLDLLAAHVESGEGLPATLRQKMIEAKNFTLS